jgi:uncharacterized protein (TIGR03437 family)
VPVSESQIETGIRLTATYDPRSRIQISSTPSGLVLTVDSAECRTPCEVERSVGSAVQLFAPPSIATGDGVRLDFSAWEGTSGAALTARAGIMRITARYVTSYRLALSAQPDNGGAWKISPASMDGYYAAGAQVLLGVDPAAGFRFHGWTLDLSGSLNPATVLMDRPHAVTAVWDSLPAPPPPPRVLNAAGETPIAAVAPGSIASLFGSDLARTTEKYEGGPLRQSLGGVTLRCLDRVLGLFYAGPQQVNFQVPSDFAPGDYRLELHRDDGSVLNIAFAVAPNAPGLFLATHADGSAITNESPAGRGETILLYGTGFGRYQTAPADGFPVPPSPSFGLVDEVSVTLQGQSISPNYAVAVPGSIGLVMIEVQIPQEANPAATVNAVVTAGGVASNVLPLPLRF